MGEDTPQNLWATNTRLYWTTGNPPSQIVGADLSNPSLTRSAISSVSNVVDIEVDPLGSQLYATNGGVFTFGGDVLYAGSAGRFDASDLQKIFVISPDIVSFAKDGSTDPDTILSAGRGGFVSVASDITTVFALSASGVVARVEKDGTNPNENLAALLVLGNDIAVDDANDVYVATADSIARLPKVGGAVATLATGSAPWRLLLDDQYVYWFDKNNADVWRTTR